LAGHLAPRATGALRLDADEDVPRRHGGFVAEMALT